VCLNPLIFYSKTVITLLITFCLLCNRVVAYSYQNSGNYTIYIVQEGWHTGIVLETNAIPDSLWHGISRFRQHVYLDIGWGDEFFYQEPGTNILLALRAAIFPTKSVIRVHGFRTDPIYYFSASATLFQMAVSPEQFYSLVNFIASSFIRDNNDEIILSERQERVKIFYMSKQHYHIFRTCNSWVCKALKESSIPIRSAGIITKWQLIRQLNRLDDKAIRRIH